MEMRQKKLLLLLGDFVLLYGSLFLTLYLRFWPIFDLEKFKSHLFPFTFLYFFWILIFYIFGLYDLLPPRFPFFLRLVSALLVCFFVGTLFFYFLPFFGISPKTILILDLLIFMVLIFSWRVLFFSIFSSYLKTKILILGKGNEIEKLKEEILKNPALGYQVFELNPKEVLEEKIKNAQIHTIIFSPEFEKNQEFLNSIDNLFPLGINFLSLADAFEEILEKIPVSAISKTWFLENLKEGKKKIYDKFKRVFDIVFALSVLAFTFPFWILIALAIKIEDKGPVFYSQKRVGKNKKIFNLIKFRSMVLEAEKEGPKWAEKEDERVTKVGRFLRRYHLDELPQMVNILKGEISVVGPRPERPEFVEKLEKEIPYYHLRHIIKPGFTGWAQIKFRYARTIMDSFEKFQYDLYYIKNRNLFLDLRILLKTFQLFFRKE